MLLLFNFWKKVSFVIKQFSCEDGTKKKEANLSLLPSIGGGKCLCYSSFSFLILLIMAITSPVNMMNVPIQTRLMYGFSTT